jgi:hypothetical protein
MDLRTFLPPTRIVTAPLPRLGEPAPGLGEPPLNGPALIAFLRHVGCPFAEATLLALRESASGHPQTRFIAVSHAPADATAGWAEQAGGAGAVQLRSDPERALYAAWGLGNSTLSHWAGGRSLRAVAEQARHGIRNRHPVGTRWQSAGTFAVDATGTVRFVHVPGHAGELPDLEVAVGSLSAD